MTNTNSRAWSLGLFLLASLGLKGVDADTARLSAHLQRFRAYKIYKLQGPEYRAVQSELIAWVKVRIAAGENVEQLNGDLAAANLLSNGSQAGDDIEKSFAGFLRKIQTLRDEAPTDLFAVKLGIYTGSFCGYDDTILVYALTPLRFLTQVNADDSHADGSHLRAFAAGANDPHDGRILASQWVLSNCTSTWNGEFLRIDTARGKSFANVLNRGVSAHDVGASIKITGRNVTFLYESSMGDSRVLVRPGIARYRIEGNRAARQAPIAKSYAGFVDEWLEMSDSEANAFAVPSAARVHHDLSLKKMKQLLHWERAADCPGRAREIVARWIDTGDTTVFLVGGATAAEMRMLAVSNKRNPGCREIDITNLSAILDEPKE